MTTLIKSKLMFTMTNPDDPLSCIEIDIIDPATRSNTNLYFPQHLRPSDAGSIEVLKVALNKVSTQTDAGYRLNVNKTVRNKDGSLSIHLCCSCFRGYRGDLTEDNSTAVAGAHFRNGIKSEKMNNQKTAIAHGVHNRSQRRGTYRPIGSEDKCLAKLLIKTDPSLNRFYVKAGSGSNIHNHLLGRFTTGSTITPEILQAVEDATEALLPPAVAQARIFAKTGQAVDTHFLRSIKRRLGFSKVQARRDPKYSRTVDDLIAALTKDPNLGWVALVHEPPLDNDPQSRGRFATLAFKGIPTEEELMLSSKPYSCEYDTAAQVEVISLRRELGVTNSEHILIALFWATTNNLRLFQKFPEVMAADATFGTNCNRCFLTQFCGKDSIGKWFVFVKGFHCNQKTSLWNWIFGDALPHLVGEDLCKKTRLILFDGDDQANKGIDRARCFLHVFSNALRRRCLFHLITQKLKALWKKKNPSVLQQQTWDYLVSWVNDLARLPESKAEFDYFRRELEKWIDSPSVRKILRSSVCDSVFEWMAQSLFPYEDNFAGYVYRNTRTYEISTTSPVESFHKQVKRKDVGTRPQLALSESFKVIQTRDCIRFDLHLQALRQDYHSKPTWTDLHGCGDVTSRAVGLLKEQLEASVYYASVQVDCCTWLVRCKHVPKNDGPKPKPIRSRTVALSPRRFLSCDCKNYESNGIICGHMLHVLYQYFETSQDHQIPACQMVGFRFTKAHLKDLVDRDPSEITTDVQENGELLDELEDEGISCSFPCFLELKYGSKLPSFPNLQHSHLYCMSDFTDFTRDKNHFSNTIGTESLDQYPLVAAHHARVTFEGSDFKKFKKRRHSQRTPDEQVTANQNNSFYHEFQSAAMDNFRLLDGQDEKIRLAALAYVADMGAKIQRMIADPSYIEQLAEHGTGPLPLLSNNTDEGDRKYQGDAASSMTSLSKMTFVLATGDTETSKDPYIPRKKLHGM